MNVQTILVIWCSVLQPNKLNISKTFDDTSNSTTVISNSDWIKVDDRCLVDIAIDESLLRDSRTHAVFHTVYFFLIWKIFYHLSLFHWNSDFLFSSESSWFKDNTWIWVLYAYAYIWLVGHWPSRHDCNTFILLYGLESQFRILCDFANKCKISKISNI